MICGRLYISKVAMAIFLVPHSFPELPPWPHQEVESFSSPCKPGQAFVTAWTRRGRKNKRCHMTSGAWSVKRNTESAWLSLGTLVLGILPPYWEEEQDTWKQYVGCSSQRSRSTPRLMSEQCSDDASPQLSCLEQRRALPAKPC